MTREEFKAEAAKYGYSESEIEELLKLHDELGAQYNEIPLLERIVD